MEYVDYAVEHDPWPDLFIPKIISGEENRPRLRSERRFDAHRLPVGNMRIPASKNRPDFPLERGPTLRYDVRRVSAAATPSNRCASVLPGPDYAT